VNKRREFRRMETVVMVAMSSFPFLDGNMLEYSKIPHQEDVV